MTVSRFESIGFMPVPFSCKRSHTHHSYLCFFVHSPFLFPPIFLPPFELHIFRNSIFAKSVLTIIPSYGTCPRFNTRIHLRKHFHGDFFWTHSDFFRTHSDFCWTHSDLQCKFGGELCRNNWGAAVNWRFPLLQCCWWNCGIGCCVGIPLVMDGQKYLLVTFLIIN